MRYLSVSSNNSILFRLKKESVRNSTYVSMFTECRLFHRMPHLFSFSSNVSIVLNVFSPFKSFCSFSSLFLSFNFVSYVNSLFLWRNELNVISGVDGYADFSETKTKCVKIQRMNATFFKHDCDKQSSETQKDI